MRERIRAAAIHGDKDQMQRTQTLNAFKVGICPVLIATDVAARGLDIKEVKAVVCYDFPNNVEDYVHRIGRTGRAGATGVAVSFWNAKTNRKQAYQLQLARERLLPGGEERVRLALGARAARAADAVHVL